MTFFPPQSRASPVAEPDVPQLLHWPTRRRGANDSDEDEGLISTGRGGKRERKEKESFIARRLIPPPPDSHVLPHHPQPGVMCTVPDTRGQMGPGRRLGGTEGHCFIKTSGKLMSGGIEQGSSGAFAAVGLRPALRAPVCSQLLGFGGGSCGLQGVSDDASGKMPLWRFPAMHEGANIGCLFSRRPFLVLRHPINLCLAGPALWGCFVPSWWMCLGALKQTAGENMLRVTLHPQHPTFGLQDPAPPAISISYSLCWDGWRGRRRTILPGEDWRLESMAGAGC